MHRRMRTWCGSAARVLFVAGLLAGLLQVLAPVPVVRADTFTVNSTADTNDANPGDGYCKDGDDNCSLRAAITEANAWAGADVITLPIGTYTLSITGTDEYTNATGDLNILEDLTINGGGQDSTFIDGGWIDRVLHITSTVAVEINDLTVRHGTTVTKTGSGDGDDGGGIYNAGHLTLNRCTVTDNRTADGEAGNPVGPHLVGQTGGQGGDGGGIYSSNALTLAHSTVLSNATGTGGSGGPGGYGTSGPGGDGGTGGRGGQGGGIYTTGDATMVLTHTVVLSNTTGAGGRGGLGGTGDGGRGGDGGAGGCGGTGGGMCNYGPAKITISTLRGNHTGAGGAGGDGGQGDGSTPGGVDGDAGAGGGGGGVGSFGSLSITASTVLGNGAGEGGPDGGNGGPGGGIYTVEVLELSRSTVSENRAGTGGLTDGLGGDGGGIYNFGSLTITETTVNGNTSGLGGPGGGNGGHGGGIHNTSGHTLALENSTVSGNGAGHGGSGVVNDGGFLSIGPGGDGGHGGGIYNGDGTVDLTNATITQNAAGAGGPGRALGVGPSKDAPGADGLGGGIYEASGDTTTLKNTILAGNAVFTDTTRDCSGFITSQDYNLVGDSTGCDFAAQANDLLGTAVSPINPMLGPLALNPPGDTATHALLAGSPAIDAIPPVSCTVTTDQRGVQRPNGPNCDIGAYEGWIAVAVGGVTRPLGRSVFLGPLVGLLAVVGLSALLAGPLRRRGR